MKIKVKVYQTDPCNCLTTFVTVGEEKERYFNRFDSTYSADWYTATSSYFESDSRVRDDVTFEIVDDKGIVHCAESNGKPVAFIPYEEKAKEVAVRYRESFLLHSYDEWKMWLLEEQKAYGNNDYPDNWVFCTFDIVSSVTLESYWHIGIEFVVKKDSKIHRVSGKEWSLVHIEKISPNFPKYKECAAVCGYIYDDSKGTPFSGDEQMKDFHVLTRDEFLRSYSYLTLEDYNATLKELKGV